jgi:hypothetical protein
MPHASCAHCGTEIADHTTMTERKGELYCCVNCAEVATAGGGRTAAQTCGHCSAPLVDTSTQVTQGGATYCCNNCAIAAGATTPTTP